MPFELKAALNIGVALSLLSACSTSLDDSDQLVERRCSLAIEHVSIVPMDSNRILADQTVRIAGSRIASVEPANRPGASCDRTINGRGKYLAPGLNDMHVHVESVMFQTAFGAPASAIPFEDALFGYLASGVTGLRVMSGAPDILAFRNSSHGPAPLLIVASPMLSGDPPAMPAPITSVITSPAQAADIINRYADSGYDLIKIRDNLAPDVLKAVGEAAARRGLDVDGHISPATDLSAIGRRGIAHLNQLAARLRPGEIGSSDVVQQMVDCSCYVTTTLVLEQNIADQLRDYDAMAARARQSSVHPLLRELTWVRERNPYLSGAFDPVTFDELLEADMSIVRELNLRNVPILAGTDALVPMIIPGESLHDELALLVRAGLSPYSALRTATQAPSHLFSRFSEVGVVAPEKLANLLLLTNNPLRDIGALRQPAAVIVAGQYLDRNTLNKRLETIEEQFRAD